MAEVQLSGIRKTYCDHKGRTFEALKGIDLEIAAGECFSLLGPSGCGKSTLLRIMAGMERPDSGSVTMDGKDVTLLPAERRPTAMVFQNYALFPHLTVEGNIAFGLKLRKIEPSEIKRKVGRTLEIVQLEGMAHRRINELSGGQQQRVALARVLAVEPGVILMDEPLSNLDAALRRATRSSIRRIQKDLGLTLIYVTHDQEEGLMISDRLALMGEGEILQAGTPREIFERPASSEVARFLGERNMIEAWIASAGSDGIELVLGDGPAEASRGSGVIASPVSIAMEPEAGRKVWIALRPDDLEIVQRGPGPGQGPEQGKDGWGAEVLVVSFGGNVEEVELELADGGGLVRVHLIPTRDEAEGGAKLERGAQVLLRPKPARGLLYPR